MFKRYEKYQNIVVVGPHRSGTTFTAHAIAHDLNRVAVDEKVFKHSNMSILSDLLSAGKNYIIQAPQALPWLQILLNPGDLAVYVERDHEAIAESYRRSKTQKRRKIPPAPFTPYQAFAMWCRTFINLPASDMIHYEDLVSHPLFIPKKDRRPWHYKQVDKTGTWYEKKKY